jgi:hypothetical protein
MRVCRKPLANFGIGTLTDSDAKPSSAGNIEEMLIPASTHDN